MRDYILFVDTETSGIPRNWDASYSADKNWPHIVQIAWVIYSKSGVEIKSENHYIRASDFQVDPQSTDVHGITEDFLNDKGECRADVFRVLAKDFEKFSPLIVGHFMKFDNHMLEMGFRRSGIEYAGRNLPKFCTMIAGRRYSGSVFDPRHLRLDELYETLFHKPLENHHDALSDAKATAACFFEMLGKGEINDEIIASQLLTRESKFRGKTLWIIVLILLFATIIYYLLINQ